VKAFVVLSPTFSSSDPETLTRDLQEHVKKTTAPYKYPRKVNASEGKLQTGASFHKSQEKYYLDFHDSSERDSGKDSVRALAPEKTFLNNISLHCFSCIRVKCLFNLSKIPRLHMISQLDLHVLSQAYNRNSPFCI